MPDLPKPDLPKPDLPKPDLPKPAGGGNDEGVALQDGVRQVLIDHELDREGGMVKIPQPRRKKRIVFELPKEAAGRVRNSPL